MKDTHPMKQFTAPIIVITIAAAALHASAQPHKNTEFDHSAFDRILKRHVHNERVDYLAIREHERDHLTQYLERIAAFSPDTLGRQAQLALYINLYNATMIRAVAERYHPGYSPSEKNFSVFAAPLVRVGGQTMSLNDLEHKVIRPRFKDPRIHAALVCAALSCPPLLNRAYHRDDLEETLEANMRRFVNDASRNRVDLAGNRLILSPIFQWYADDFGGQAQLADYVDRYHAESTRGFEISFTDYSWALNITDD